MNRLALRLTLLALAFVAATIVAGWWALPVLGALWGWLNRGERWAGMRTGVAAAAGWLLLLGWNAMVGPLSQVAIKAGGVMGLHPLVLYAATLLLAGLAAGAAAGLAASFRPSAG